MVKRKKLKFENWKRVMVISAHPDDAEMAMGSTIAKLTIKSREVILVVATNGELGTNEIQKHSPEKLSRIRKREQLKAAQALGVSKLTFLNLPDQKLNSNQKKLEKKLRKLLLDHRPDVVFTWDPRSPNFHLNGQPHLDHAVIGEITTQVLKNSNLNPKPEVYLFLPLAKEITYFVSIPPNSSAYKAKIKALEAHSSQFTPSMIKALQNLVVENSTKKGYCTENFKKMWC